MPSPEFAEGWPFPLAAAALALAALAIGVWADARFASAVIAIIGVPVALLGAAAPTRRWLTLVAVGAFVIDVALVVYWIYDLVSAIGD